MKNIYLLILVLLCGVLGFTKNAAADQSLQREATMSSFHAGMAVLLLPEHYETEEELAWKTDELLDRLERIGVSAVNLTWLIYTDGVTGTRVYHGPRSPSLSAIRTVAVRATERGFMVGFRPIIDEGNIDIRNNGMEWRGTLRPSSLSRWFANYRELVVQYAVLAEQLDVDYFVVGTELNSLERRTAHWEEVIGAVREVYSGQIAYARNHDHYEHHFPWRLLDFMGVDAFYRLGGPREVSVDELTRLWQPHVAEALAFAAQYELPLVLTELGTTAQEGSHRTPWVWNHRTPLSLEAQRRFYQAACRAWSHQVDGIYWWYVHVNPWMVVEPLQDYSFVPLGKPAEEEILACFRAR